MIDLEYFCAIESVKYFGFCFLISGLSMTDF